MKRYVVELDEADLEALRNGAAALSWDVAQALSDGDAGAGDKHSKDEARLRAIRERAKEVGDG